MSSKESGDLSDMAVKGTTVPEDAAKPRVIPSVPRPDQASQEFGGTDLANAATNAQDISRSTTDNAPATDVITGTGDSLPAEIGAKRLHNVTGQNADLSKGHPRMDKHARQIKSDQDLEATEGVTEEEVIDGVVGGRS